MPLKVIYHAVALQVPENTIITYHVPAVVGFFECPAWPVPAIETLTHVGASAEYRETGSGAARRYRARFWSGDALKLRELFEIVGGS